MTGKVLSLLLALTFFVYAGAFTAHAESPSEIAEDVIEFKLSESGAEDVQDWICGALTENAGVDSEWYVIVLSHIGEYDFSEYGAALEGYLEGRTVRSATTRQKYALAFMAAGYESEYISETAGNSIGEQGIMSLVYGMYMLKNGCVAEGHTMESVTAEILELQLPDGGWAVSGERGDADVTAMVLQSLAYLAYSDGEQVSSAVDAALEFLSANQLENGGFSSYGTESAESTAQVIMALSALGVDVRTEERFIKNGCTLFDVLMTYQLADGSFCHEIGGEYNRMATAQAFMAAVAYQNMDGMYDFSAKTEISAETVETSAKITEMTETTSETEETAAAPSEISEKNKSYKPVVCLIAVAAGGVACIILYACGKRNRKNFLAVAVLTALACAGIIFTDFSSAENYYTADLAKENTVGTVTMSITCEKIAGSEGAPADGIILSEGTFAIAEGETVFDILVEACRKNGIHMEHSAGYVSGIGHIYEFDFGDLSGWIYHVNGESPSVGCDRCFLSDGDKIEWLYTLETGKDL